jgi:uncharacterized protein
MLSILSPAKTLNFSKVSEKASYSEPSFVNEAGMLMKILKCLKPDEISELMGISAKLADLNFQRFLAWQKEHRPENSKPAIFAFDGDVYEGLDIETLDVDHVLFLNKNLRILSGLYGVLKPLDLIKEYRLEMGSKLKNKKGPNLYYFWGQKITQNINTAIEQSDGDKVLINLASNEYFKAIDAKALKYEVITPVFKDYKEGKYQVISYYAKKARGLMSRFIAQEKITNQENLKMFHLGSYSFSHELSTSNQFIFTR